MQRFTPLVLFALVPVTVLVTMQSPSVRSETSTKQQLLRHVVLFKFKQDAEEARIREVVTAFGQLPEKIEQIHAFEWGTNVSPEDRAKGFTHCFLVTFRSEKDLAAYLPHPAHQEFVTRLRPVLDDVLVVDYWTHE